MKKFVGLSVLSAAIIGLIAWGLSVFFSFSYMEWSFFIGLGITVILYLSNSSGGMLSRMATLEASESNWKVQEDTEQKVNVGAIFYGSVLYTIVSFIIMMITYF
ncbi:hypothetical protein [Pseudalkalibacillus caeni]|uniref:DUF3899 domain-containing protein n=1 Tax=Exobacillus caeni TaxID=2574798 RepID=A0A5R9F3E5_9BACL|nr:hypothetical protein [Pseudalkalibacillus caeni]TLS37019.1 hypothetical protein FCL54_10820 [Pseudalkalibacillus caeni]